LRRAATLIGVLLASCSLMCCGLKTNPKPGAYVAPGLVGLVVGHVYPGVVNLKWDAPGQNIDGSSLNDLAGYKVYRSSHDVNEPCGDCETMGEFHAEVNLADPMNSELKGNEVIYKDFRITIGNVYYYWVSAFSGKGIEGRKSQVIKVIYDDIPPKPEGLRSSYDSRGVVLRWDAPVRPAGIRWYKIYRGESGDLKKAEPLGRTRWAEKFYVDDAVEKDKPYYYTVRSMKKTGDVLMESGPSITVRAVYPRAGIKAPKGVTAVSTPRGIKVYWEADKSDTEQIRYNVSRSEGERMPVKINPRPLTKPWITDSKVKKGHRYRYHVRAFPAGREHEESRASASQLIEHQY
jgi:fibronectin type 3 domain-containing protein